MSTTKTITISLPLGMGKEIEKIAKEEHRTVSELLREAFRQYQSQRNLKTLSKLAQKNVRSKKMTIADS